MSWGSFIGGLFGGMGGEGASSGTSSAGGWGEWGRLLGGAIEGWGSAEASEDQLRLQAQLREEVETRLAEQQGRINRDTAAYTAAYTARLNDWAIDRDKDKRRAGASNYKQFGNVQGYTPVSTPTPVSSAPPTPQSLEDLLTGGG